MFLTPEDFYVANGELVLKIPGFAFIFFMSKECTFCDDVKPAFNRVSQMIQGCTFAYMDVDQKQQQIVTMSHQTGAPIQYVPLLLLFVNGRCVGKFTPDEDNPSNNLTKMTNFIMASASKTTGQQSASTQKQETVESDIPKYSIGIPGNLANRRVCYLGYEQAYAKK